MHPVASTKPKANMWKISTLWYIARIQMRRAPEGYGGAFRIGPVHS